MKGRARPSRDDSRNTPCRNALLSTRWALTSVLVLLSFPTMPGCQSEPVGASLLLEQALSLDPSSSDQAETDSRSISMRSAINEVVSFRLRVRPVDRPTKRATISIAPLRSSASAIDPSAIAVFRMRRVKVPRWPGWHIRSITPDQRDPEPFDVLVPWRAPRGGMPGVLLPGQEYWFWVDIAVPKGTPPGNFSGRIAVLDDGKNLAAVDLSLEVLPFVLPDSDPIPMVADLDHRALMRHHLTLHGAPYAPPSDDWRSDPLRQQIDDLLQGTMRMLRSHRLTPVLPYLVPSARIDARGSIKVDWAAYDAVIAPYLEGRGFDDREPVAAWPLPRSLLETDRLGRDRDAADGLARQALRACAYHFRERGWLDRAYAEVPVPTGSVEAAFQYVRRFSGLVRAADASLALLSQLFPQDMTPFGWPGFPGDSPAGLVDIWAPPAQFFDRTSMGSERTAGRRTWMTVDRPPFSGSVELGTPAGCVLGLPWQASWLGAEAIRLSLVNPWPDETSIDPQACIDVDTQSLIYPGTAFGLSVPVASVRLKLLRRSMYDAAYRSSVRTQGDEHIAEALNESLVGYAGTEAYRAHFADGRPVGFELEARPYAAARSIMAERIALEGVASDSVEQEMAWRRFMLDARRVDVVQDGCRVRGTSNVQSEALGVDCWFTVTNRMRVPIEGVRRWELLPKGWEATDQTQLLSRIDPNSSHRFLMSAEASKFETTAGHVPLSAVLATDGGFVRRVPLRVSFVSAELTDRAPVIDGDLSDWVPGRFNVAGDFGLISSIASGVDQNEIHPSARTVAFVARDREALYLAVNAARRPGVPLNYRNGNAMRYEDMVPVGEELIEVLFDPLNAGTRSPSDLYHLVVKPSGAHLSERGIRFEPPCGTRGPWSADVRVATRIDAERWTVEMRIPLQSFDGAASASTIWGFNVTRFDATDQQFSTWSGAVGNAYDPLSMGNLFLASVPK